MQCSDMVWVQLNFQFVKRNLPWPLSCRKHLEPLIPKMELLTFFDYLGIMTYADFLCITVGNYQEEDSLSRSELSVSSKAEKNAQRKVLTPSYPT